VRGGNNPRNVSNPGSGHSLEQIIHRYDRVARVYSVFEPLYGIFPTARRRAVAALQLHPGADVLEVGAGTGRNLPYLMSAIGPSGRVFAVDASPGMLAQARRLIDRRGWQNVELLEQDAAVMGVEATVDAVLFSLSYSVLPDRVAALSRAWTCLRPGGRLVVMDAGLPHSRLDRFLRPVIPLLIRFAPGDAYSHPWDDLAAYGPVSTERFLFNLYFVCAIDKPVNA
jgi:ubiquinone/menaquinone biosynthesis C-methylase UbiE